MAKTNFTKVEDALKEGMLQMTKQHLHSLADAIAGIDKNPENQKKLLAALKMELSWMQKQDSALHQKLGITKPEIKELIAKENLSQEDLDKIKIIKEKIDQLKKEFDKTDDQIIEKERKKHVNKRFNTNDDWLPLH